MGFGEKVPSLYRSQILSKLFLNSPLQKAAEFFGAAGEFCCHSLHQSQIVSDL
jgi:hypothetical protein